MVMLVFRYRVMAASSPVNIDQKEVDDTSKTVEFIVVFQDREGRLDE